MRKLVASFSLVALLSAATPARAQSDERKQPGFQGLDCALNATHILVVERTGRIVEVWKGAANVGDWLPIERFFSSSLARHALTSPSQFCLLRPIDPDNLFEPLQGAHRLVLFLVKSDQQDEATKFLGGWLPASRSGWFTSSVARVSALGAVSVQSIRARASTGLTSGNMGSEEQFKAWVSVLLKQSTPADTEK